MASCRGYTSFFLQLVLTGFCALPSSEGAVVKFLLLLASDGRVLFCARKGSGAVRLGLDSSGLPRGLQTRLKPPRGEACRHLLCAPCNCQLFSRAHRLFFGRVSGDMCIPSLSPTLTKFKAGLSEDTKVLLDMIKDSWKKLPLSVASDSRQLLFRKPVWLGKLVRPWRISSCSTGRWPRVKVHVQS